MPIAVAILPLAAGTALLAQDAPAPKNLVGNPFLSDGVYGPSYWGLNRSGDRRVDWYASEDADEFALRLQGSGRDWAGATSQGAPVTPGEQLAVAGWIRSDSHADDPDRLFVRFFGDRGFMGQTGPAVPPNIAEWRLLSGTVSVPEGAKQADVSLQIWSAGTVWLHSAGLFRGTAVPDEALPRPRADAFSLVELPRGKPEDRDANGLPDVLERALGITGEYEARSTRPAPRKTTSFQTPTGYREDNDLKVDVVIVAGNDAHSIRSWQDFGYETHCMGGFRAGPGYVETNPHEPQTDAGGTQLTCGPGSYYMVPTAQRRGIMAEYFAQAVRNGAQAVCPEEPEFFNRAGYSAAFKAEWQRAYGEPWQDPASSVNARLKAERLKAELEQQLLTDIYRASREVDPDVPCFLLAHSPLNYSAWGITFAHCSMLRTGLVDRFVAQVWTGTARSAITHRGKAAERTFENAFLEYSSSWNLVRGLDIPIWFLMDPVEDNPGRAMEDYHDNYERTLAASLLFPDVDRFEVMPWPTRIFGRVPDDFATEITGVIRLLNDMQAVTPRPLGEGQGARVEWDCGTRGIATFIADSAMFQRGAPAPSDMADIYGLCLPLLMRGMPVQIAHLDRVTDPGYLDPYHTLLASYDAFKPQSLPINETLAHWVEAGGSLLVFGGDDAYNEADEWWRDAGFPGPTEHLLSLLGLDVSRRRVVAAPDHPWIVVAETDYAGRNLENRAIEEIDLSPFLAVGRSGFSRDAPGPAGDETASDRAGAGVVYVKLEDTLKGDGWGPSIFGLELDGIQAGNAVRETIVPGSRHEAELIFDDHNTGFHTEPNVRFADRDTYVVYRISFDRGARAVVRLDVGNQYRISVSAAPPDRTRVFAADARSDADLWQLPLTRTFVTYDDSGARAIVADGDDALAIEKPFGKGRVLFCGLPGRHFAGSDLGDRRLRALVKRAVRATGRKYVEKPYIKLRRGDYIIAKTFDGELRIRGRYVDVLEPDLPVVNGVQLAPDSLAVLKRVTPDRMPGILFCSSCIEWESEEPNRTRLIVSDALGVKGSLRLWTAGREVDSISSVSATGDEADVAVRTDEDTVLLTYDNRPGGLAIDIRWR